jgi:hypothetical protein
LWKREFYWKDIPKLRFMASQLRNARSYAEQTLKVQTGAEQSGLCWEYRRIRFYGQLGRKVEMLKEGIPAIGI